jgi:hypothetical protein
MKSTNWQQLTLEPLTIQNKQMYQDFTSLHERAYLHHSLAFTDVLIKLDNSENSSLLILDKSSNLIGVMPQVTKTRKLANRIRNPFGFKGNFSRSLGGLLLLEAYSDYNAIHGLIASSASKKTFFSEISIDYCLSSLDLLSGKGLFNLSEMSVIDLTQPTTDLWRNMREGHRQTIKKAIRENQLSFRLGNLNDLPKYYELHIETYRRNKITPHPFEYFKSIFKDIFGMGNAAIGCIEYQGKPIAFSIYGLYKNRSHYWANASSEISKKLGANHLLHWEMFQILQDLGIEQLEMGEVLSTSQNPKLRGISEFKTGFGGTIYPRNKYSSRGGLIYSLSRR